MNKIKVGVIGCGFVGSAVAAGFALKADVKIYDKHKDGFDTLSAVCGQDIIFLCLPTPMRKSDGLPEMSFIHDAIMAIQHELAMQNNWGRKIIVIKSTVLPGTNRALQEAYPQFTFVSNPEFLTARSARLDFINAARVIIGGENSVATNLVAELYRTISTHTPVYLCAWEEAEFVKYMCNCFFALKITYLNEIYLTCKNIGISYNHVKQMFLADGRIGNSHHEVPGHDGDLGFGGTCFPKDTSAFVEWAKQSGGGIFLLDVAQHINNAIRKNKDWEVFDDTQEGVRP